MFKVGIVGPESTGKSALSASLAKHFHTEFVPEIARVYLDELGKPYEKADLLHIAKQQVRAENKVIENANQILICDTTLLVIKIWSLVKYAVCDPWILAEENNRKYDLFLLTDIDLPWENDPYREHPNERESLFDFYHKELSKKDIPFHIIRGKDGERLTNALNAIKQHYDFQE